jgi:hypothetical protein
VTSVSILVKILTKHAAALASMGETVLQPVVAFRSVSKAHVARAVVVLSGVEVQGQPFTASIELRSTKRDEARQYVLDDERLLEGERAEVRAMERERSADLSGLKTKGRDQRSVELSGCANTRLPVPAWYCVALPRHHQL